MGAIRTRAKCGIFEVGAIASTTLGGHSQMNRRELITVLGTTVAAWPMGAFAQQQLPVIGFLSSASVSGPVPLAFGKGLSQAGYVRNQNVIIETVQAGGRYDELPALAAGLVHRQVNVIVAAGGLMSARAAIAATTTIPVLFIAGFDPVKLGLVSSFNRPGGNATGVSIYTTELLAKRLELFRELVPGASRIALLVNADNVISEIEIDDMEMVAKAAGLQLIIIKADAATGFEAAFASAAANRADALLVSADPFFTTRRGPIVALAVRHGFPAAYPWLGYVEAGGLFSYGPSLMDAYEQIGAYAGRILKGARAGDLPVRLPFKFELGINVKTAKALNLKVPRLTLLRADHVIE
jgi:putative ABC transport system substrate-binding protein